MTPEYAADSIEYVRVHMAVTISGVLYDPTADVVKMTFTTADRLTGTEVWYDGTWESAGTTHYARCLIGPAPGKVELAPGVWWVWVKVTDSPEVPLKRAGTIEII